MATGERYFDRLTVSGGRGWRLGDGRRTSAERFCSPQKANNSSRFVLGTKFAGLGGMSSDVQSTRIEESVVRTQPVSAPTAERDQQLVEEAYAALVDAGFARSEGLDSPLSSAAEARVRTAFATRGLALSSSGTVTPRAVMMALVGDADGDGARDLDVRQLQDLGLMAVDIAEASARAQLLESLRARPSVH